MKLPLSSMRRLGCLSGFLMSVPKGHVVYDLPEKEIVTGEMTEKAVRLPDGTGVQKLPFCDYHLIMSYSENDVQMHPPFIKK